MTVVQITNGDRVAVERVAGGFNVWERTREHHRALRIMGGGWEMWHRQLGDLTLVTDDRKAEAIALVSR